MQLPNGQIHRLNSPPAGGKESSNDESVELARFRAEWKAEVERKRGQDAQGATSKSKEKTVDRSHEPHQVEQKLLLNRPATRATAPAHTSASTSTSHSAPAASHPAIQNGAITSASTSQTHENALAAYRKAVQCEQSGDLDSALASYRQAFRLDPYVDRAYHREQLLKSKLRSYTEKVPGTAAPSSTPSVAPISPDLLAADLHKLSIPEPPKGSLQKTQATLDHITQSWPLDLAFEPEDEKQTVFLTKLPPEIMYLVIRKLDIPTLERFALVCRRARVMTLDPVYWSELVQRTYKPPQIPDAEDLLAIITKHDSNFRQLYIAQPRVRMDGLYIAICHYTRPGLSENSWVNVNHLITYHRYLRFYPNGQVLSLLANEELAPQQVIPLMKPTLRMKGFFIGNWFLTGTTLSVVNLMDASGKYIVPGHDDTLLASDLSSVGYNRQSPSPAPGAYSTALSNSITNNHPMSSSTNPSSTQPRSGRGGHSHGHGHGHGASAPEPAQIRYVFDMSLELRSKPLGRWNRLDLVTYDSVNLETGEVQPVLLKHERPFWFSKVRSYG